MLAYSPPQEAFPCARSHSFPMRRLRSIPCLPRSDPMHRLLFHKKDRSSSLPRFSACILTHFYCAFHGFFTNRSFCAWMEI